MTNQKRIFRPGRAGFAGAAATLAVSFLLLVSNTAAQQRSGSLRDRLVGTWLLVSAEAEQNGNKVEFFGPNPVGVFFFDANGRFFSQVSRADLPKFASGSRYQGTPDENKAVIQGFIAYFGTYSVTDSGELTLHMLSSSYPNFNGTDQKRNISIQGDEMQYRSGGTSFGANALEIWRRIGPGEKLTK